MMKSLFDNEESVKAVEALIAWMRSQDIGPTEGVPILAAAMVVAVVSHGKTKGWKEQTVYESVVLAGQTVVETIGECNKRGARKQKRNRNKNEN